MDLVVDASVALKWLLAEPDSDIALRLRADHDILAPDLLLIECRNAVLTSLRRRRLSLDQARMAERDIDAFGITIMPSEPLLARAFAIALDLGTPIYDSVYLAAAIAAGRQLITADHRFASTASASGHGHGRIKVLGAALP